MKIGRKNCIVNFKCVVVFLLGKSLFAYCTVADEPYFVQQ